MEGGNSVVLGLERFRKTSFGEPLHKLFRLYLLWNFLPLLVVSVVMSVKMFSSVAHFCLLKQDFFRALFLPFLATGFACALPEVIFALIISHANDDYKIVLSWHSQIRELHPKNRWQNKSVLSAFCVCFIGLLYAVHHGRGYISLGLVLSCSFYGSMSYFGLIFGSLYESRESWKAGIEFSISVLIFVYVSLFFALSFNHGFQAVQIVVVASSYATLVHIFLWQIMEWNVLLSHLLKVLKRLSQNRRTLLIAFGLLLVFLSYLLFEKSKTISLFVLYAYVRLVKLTLYKRDENENSGKEEGKKFFRVGPYVYGIYVMLIAVLLLSVLQEHIGIDAKASSAVEVQKNRAGKGFVVKASDHMLEIDWTEGSNPPSNAFLENICLLNPKGVSLIDYALFAQLAYLDPLSEDWKIVRESFFADWKEVGIDGVANYYEFYNQETNLTVIAIPGTGMLKLKDWAQDIDIFAESAVMAFFSQFTPFLSWWRSLVNPELLQLGRFVETLLPYDRDRFYHTIAMNATKAAMMKGDVMVVGHSLGGAIAKMVSGLLNVSAVSVSGPGISEIAEKLNFQQENFINLISDDDIVAHVGTHSGLIAKFPCPFAKRNPTKCHLPIVALRWLIDRCGKYHPKKVISYKFN